MWHAPRVEILNLISSALLLMNSLWRYTSAIEHESLRTLLKDAIDTIVTNSRLDQERVGCINRRDQTWDSRHMRSSGRVHAIVSEGYLPRTLGGFMSCILLHER